MTRADAGLHAGPSPTRRRSRRSSLPVSRIMALTVLAAALLGGGLSFEALSLRGEGYRVVIVNGGSMGESIPSGSLVVARWHASADIAAGDVILVNDDSASTQPKIHRVIDVTKNDDSYVVHTKGDGNETPDPEAYQLPDRVLVSRGHVPYLGMVATAIASPAGWLLMVALPLTLVAALTILSIWRPRKRAAGA